jgi:hypothetical protein
MILSHEDEVKIEKYLPSFFLSLWGERRMLTMQILFSTRGKMVGSCAGGRRSTQF